MLGSIDRRVWRWGLDSMDIRLLSCIFSQHVRVGGFVFTVVSQANECMALARFICGISPEVLDQSVCRVAVRGL